jgi:hypothetical protein
MRIGRILREGRIEAPPIADEPTLCDLTLDAQNIGQLAH